MRHKEEKQEPTQTLIRKEKWRLLTLAVTEGGAVAWCAVTKSKHTMTHTKTAVSWMGSSSFRCVDLKHARTRCRCKEWKHPGGKTLRSWWAESRVTLQQSHASSEEPRLLFYNNEPLTEFLHSSQTTEPEGLSVWIRSRFNFTSHCFMCRLTFPRVSCHTLMGLSVCFTFRLGANYHNPFQIFLHIDLRGFNIIPDNYMNICHPPYSQVWPENNRMCWKPA